MRKISLYALLVTLCLWLGGIVPLVHSAQQVSEEYTEAAMTAGDVADAHAAGHETPFILNVDLGSAVWNLVVFLLLLVVLAKFVWPPILQGLQQREQKIRGDLEGAERANREAQATLERYKTQLAEAQREAQRIIEQSKSDAQRVAAQLKAQAEAELKQMRDRAEADISAAKEQAIAEVYEQTAVLATQVAAQILQREVRAEDHQRLVQQSLNGLEAVQAG
jgi:F-type H+-transporting ATPase subunit b